MTLAVAIVCVTIFGSIVARGVFQERHARFWLERDMDSAKERAEEAVAIAVAARTAADEAKSAAERVESHSVFRPK